MYKDFQKDASKQRGCIYLQMVLMGSICKHTDMFDEVLKLIEWFGTKDMQRNS